MSLGVKSLWRAQTWSVCTKKLSLIPVPREQHHDKFRRWMSLSAPKPSSPGEAEEDQTGNETKTENAPEDENIPNLTRTRILIKHTIKHKRSRRPSAAALVKLPAQYPSKHETERSFRKHVESADRQHMHDFFRLLNDKPDDDWRSTVDFMLQHTPSAEEMFNIKVVIGRGAAQEARRTLSGLDTNIGQIERRNQSVIRFEESLPGDESLVLTVAGTETAVHDSLRDIIRTSGQLTAIRILDDIWKEKLSDIYDSTGTDQPLKLYSDGEAIVGDTTMTVQSDSAFNLGEPGQLRRYPDYVLTKRADDITPPAEWTKVSFEKYIASLVYGVMPTYLARQLYKAGPSHQETVVSLLIDAFTSEYTQSALSVSALKMALAYIHLKGPVFRPAARQLFARAEALNLALDAETLGIFLGNASRASELNNFNNILKLMVRKRFYLQSHTWYAFLEMIQHSKIKRYIIDKMEAGGLHRIPPFLVGIGRQLAPIDLEDYLLQLQKEGESGVCNIRRFVHSHDAKYGKEWLNTTTFNKMLDLLGRRGQLDACHELLDLVHAHKRTSPDAYTLNTMITHMRKILDHIALLQSMPSHWPWIRPDVVTYKQLFTIAWTKRFPNMLRVLFRYAVHDRLLSPKVAHRLSTLLWDGERNFSNRRFLLKSWEDVIFGREELEAAKRERLFGGSADDDDGGDDNNKDNTEDKDSKDILSGKTLTAYHVEKRHLANAAGMVPSVSFAEKLKEAYELDREIHRFVKEGRVLTPAMREKLTVGIPLRKREEKGERSPLPAP